MSAITLPELPATPAILDRQHLIVQVKKKWTDAWKPVPYISFEGCEDHVAPSVGNCTLIWRWGQIKREDAVSFTVASPQDLTDWFVQISQVVASESLSMVPTTVPVWTGVIQPSTHQLLGDGSIATGADQVMTAYSVIHLLDRVALDKSWALPVGSSKPVAIDTMPMVNDKVGGGYDISIGNRSSNKYPSEYGGESYVFSEDGNAFTVYDYIEYLIVRFPPGGPIHGDIPISLSGQTEALQVITMPKVAQHWGTLKDALDDLISARRGLGYVARVTDVTNEEGGITGTGLSVHVFSTAAKPINIAGTMIPANGEQQVFEPGTRKDIQTINLTMDPIAQYERLIVRGKPILSCFTLALPHETLLKSWLDDDEDTYLAGDATTRASDALRHVYRLFAPRSTWDWWVGSAQHRNANPGCNANGVVTDLLRGPSRRWGYRFERFIPIAKAGSVLTQAELSEPLAWMQSQQNGKFYQTDSPPDDQDLPACSIRVSSTGLAFELATDPAHLIAYGHTDGAATLDQEPQVNYETMFATLAARTDQRLQVTSVLLQSFTTTRPGRTKTIDVPDAEAWYIVPGTVIGMENGSLKQHDGGMVRDDSPILRATAAIARAWYGTPRSTAEIAINGVAQDFPLGTMITTVIAGDDTYSVNTVVSTRSIQPSEKYYNTQIKTGYEDLDFPNLDARIKTADAVDTQSIPVRIPKTNPMRPAGRYRLVTVETDHLICTTWDGTAAGSDMIKIARPECCRSSHLAGFSKATEFIEVDPQTIVATGVPAEGEDPVSEVWRITPSYIEGESEIYAEPVRRGTGSTTPCTLIDTSKDRQWVMTFENPDDLIGE